MDDHSLSKKELQALRHIRNRIVHGEEPPSVRELQELMGYGSPNAAAYVISRLMQQGYIQRRKDRKLQLLRDVSEEPAHERTVQVPLVGRVPCGVPFLAEENVEALIPVSTRMARPPYRYFLLRAEGNSMNRAGIQDGDWPSFASSRPLTMGIASWLSSTMRLPSKSSTAPLMRLSSSPAHRRNITHHSH